MENSTTAPKSPRVISNLRLRLVALVSVIAVFMVTVLPAATGDNIADAVLGQIDFAHNGPNDPNATSLNSPGQMTIDLSGGTQHLYVVDTNNNRILGWNDATSFSSGQPADLEIGQPDFETTLCNSGTADGDVGGVGPDSLCLPGGVAVDSSGNLYVADTLNSRVLVYVAPFTQSKSTGFSAAFVYGQGSFTGNVCAQTATGLCDPQGVALDSSNDLYVADSGNNRVLEYNLINGAIAQLVYGQGASGTDFIDDDCDIVDGGASRTGMCNPLSVAVDSAGDLYVGDDSDHRVLEFAQGNVTPNLVFGQGSSGADFTDIGCHDGVGIDPATSADGLCNLSGVAVDSSLNLYVTDITNSRVLEYLSPTASGGGTQAMPGSSGDVTADVVFGQNGSFTTGICGGTATSGIAASGSVLCQPDGVAVDIAGDVFVTDASNSRVLDYTNPQAAPPIASLVLGEMDLVHNGVNNPTASALQQPSGVAIRFRRRAQSSLRRRLGQ